MKNLYRLSFFTAFMGAVLIVAGGLVTSHQAGLSVPDWPLSYGKWMPPMVGKIFWEHGHRMIAAFVGFLTLVMVIATHLTRGASSGLKSFSRALIGLVILQGVFGGLTVLFNLPHLVSIGHASLGQIYFSALWLFSYAARLEAEPLVFRVSAENQPKLAKAFRIARVTWFIFIAQLLLGAATRHIKHVHIAYTHAAFAFVVVTHVVLVFLRVTQLDKEDQAPQQIVLFLLIAVMLQVLLGVCSLGLTQFMNQVAGDPSQAQIWTTTFHQSLGAFLLAAIMLLTFMLQKRVQFAANA